MLRFVIITALFAACPSFAIAASDQSWPWVLFGPRIDSCSQLDETMRRRLSDGIAKASKSTTNLLPARIWHTYEEKISRETGTKQVSLSTRMACETFIAELEAPNLSGRLRGDFFFGLLQRAALDCVLDDADKGKNFLIEFQKFYERNGLVYPDETIQTQLAKMRAENLKALNGWDTPHCMDMQRSLSTGELDLSVSEEMMRKNWFAK